MRIGILATIVGEMGEKGFYQQQEIGLGKSLAALGHDVTVYRCVQHNRAAREEQADTRLRICFLPVFALGIHGFFPRRRIDTDLDGLIMFADTQLAVPAAYRFCRRHGIVFLPYVGVVHSQKTGVHARMMDWLYLHRNRPIYRKTQVFAKTDGVREELLSQGVRDCSVHPVGIDLSVLKSDFRTADRKGLREKYGYGDEDRVICFVGRLEAQKRPLEMLALFDELRKKKKSALLLIGDGSLRSEVDREIARRGLARLVRAERKVPYGEMWERYYISDYLVNLNTDEIFGMAVLEAVYYGLSTAARSSPGPDLILRDLPGHCLCRSDEEILEWIASDPPPSDDLKKSAELLKERCSWRDCAEAFVERTEAIRKKSAIRN